MVAAESKHLARVLNQDHVVFFDGLNTLLASYPSGTVPSDAIVVNRPLNQTF